MDFPKSVPSVGLVNGKFVDEDTGTATPGSLIPAAWGNAVTGEILAVIEAADLDPEEGNNTQLIQAVKKLINGGLASQATEETPGIAKIATDADFVAAVADNTKIVTVQKIKTWFSGVMKQATEAAFGWARIATQSQTNSGVDDTTIVTPKKLSVALAALVISATEIIVGLIRIATQAQTNEGADDASAVTPKKLEGARPRKSQCKAWVNFNGTGTITIRDSHGVSSIVDNGTGDYTVNLSVPMANLNYAVIASGAASAAPATGINCIKPWSRSASAIGVSTTSTATGSTDFLFVDVSVYGVQ